MKLKAEDKETQAPHDAKRASIEGFAFNGDGFEHASVTLNSKTTFRYLVTILLALALGYGAFRSTNRLAAPHTDDLSRAASDNKADGDVCPQVQPIQPVKHHDLIDKLDSTYNKSDFQSWAFQNLQGAVKVPTESFDDLGPPGEDPRWDSRLKLHEYIEERFPLVREHLERQVISHYALVFHWQGTNANTKPILITAHQDTVPVDLDTVDEWLYPPFSGHFDGERIWGRGAGDCKSEVFGILSVAESLLREGFVPSRTVVFAFGMDEEKGGIESGPSIQDHLIARYGQDGFAMLVDEGTQFGERNGVIFATPSVSEKGMIDVKIEVTTAGGHSMLPPRHTSIALLSLLIAELDANPFQTRLNRNSTYLRTLECSAAHEPDFSEALKTLIFRARTDDFALQVLQARLIDEYGLLAEAMMSTSQAVDAISGGVKSNVLPTSATAAINHRIADWSSVDAVKAHYKDLLTPLAAKLNLSLEAFGENLIPADTAANADTSSAGHVRLMQAYKWAREPSPVAPTYGHGPWELLSGTILGTLQTAWADKYKGKKMVVEPGFVLGNTDTGHYWNLTKHIFRYAHAADTDLQGSHGVNEAIRVEAYLDIIRFITRLILNADETDLFD